MNDHKIHLNEPFPLLVGPVGLDIETSMHYADKSSDPFRDVIQTIQISQGNESWVVSNPALFPSIRPILECPDSIKIIHYSAFDLQFLYHQVGAIIPKESIWDTLLVERILNAGIKMMGHSLAEVVARRTGQMLNKEIRTSFGQHEGDLSPEQLNYVVEDVKYLGTIREQQMQDVAEAGLGRVVALENRLATLIARMELKGVGFDHALWDTVIKQAGDYVRNVESGLADRLDLGGQLGLFGDATKLPFNLNSTDQVLNLFSQHGIEVSGTKREVLQAWLADNPTHPHVDLVKTVIEWRTWSKMLTWNYPEAVHPVTQRIHSSWNQIEARTGRFSSSGPNLQNVPHPEAGKPNMRRCFIPGLGYGYDIADYSQQEPRILAEVSGDEALRSACQQADVYRGMAPTVYGVEIEKEDPRRRQLKIGVLADLYGASIETLQVQLGCSYNEAFDFDQKVKGGFSRAASWTKQQKSAVAAQKKTRTLLGRVSYYPEIDEPNPKWGHIYNQAVNMPIQGSGADMLKMALDRFDTACQTHGLDAISNIVVHDEIVAEVRQDQMEEAYHLLIQSMEGAGQELCPHVQIKAEGLQSSLWEKA